MAVKLIGINGKMLQSPEQYRIQPHHFNGTDYENLVEYSGRKCYDSVNTPKSRSSSDFHKHIVEVGHFSVLGHSVIHAKITGYSTDISEFCRLFSSEKGWWIEGSYICANFRFLQRVGPGKHGSDILRCLYARAKELAPLIFDKNCPDSKGPVEILKDNEYRPEGLTWYNFEIDGVSRNLSHELIRHANQSGFSQRSTRYVNENDFTFIKHPLDAMEDSDTEDYEQFCKGFYDAAFSKTYLKLKTEGVDEFTAKKQARGAAARYLPNGVETEMVFSCSRWQLDEIIKQRLNPAADKEIYLMAQELKDAVEKHNKG